MNISEAKEEILKLYLKSLKIETSDYYKHPVRLVQAVKSIIGINTDKPVEDLLFYCSSYIEKFEAKENCLSKEFSEIPLMVSYKKLEEGLLNKDVKVAATALAELKTVSEGSQIFEFFIEYSLKHSKESLVLIWSIYRMSFFSDRKFMDQELMLCVNSLIDSPKTMDFHNVHLGLIKENINYIDIYHVINSVYYSNAVRIDKMREYILSSAVYNESEISNFDYKSRNFLWKHINSLKLEDLCIENILKIDSFRAVMKIIEDQKMNPEKFYSIIRKYRDFL